MENIIDAPEVIISEERKINLLHSSLINFYLRYRSKELKQAMEIIWEDIAGHINPRIYQETRNKMKAYLKVLLINLSASEKCNHCLAVGLKKENFLRGGLYYSAGISFRAFVPLINILHENNWIHRRTGFYNKALGKGKNTRIWSSLKLKKILNAISEEFIFSTENIVKLTKKSKKKKIEVEYDENEMSRCYREKLEFINNFYDKSEIKSSEKNNPTFYFNPYLKKYQKNLKNYFYNNYFSINNTNIKLHHISSSNIFNNLSYPISKINYDKYKISYSNILKLSIYNYNKLTFSLLDPSLHPRLISIFCRGNKELECGGRLYDIPLTGISYQGLSGKQRKHITINGSETVELDYSSLHIAMLYAKEGIQLTEKPYSCFGEEYKGLFKKLLLTAINAKSPVQCVKSINKTHAELRMKPFLKENEFELLHSIEQLKPNWYDLLDELKQKHSKIASYFCSDKGVELQRRDSEIMLDIIHSLALEGIPALPVHDSVIVAKEYQELLMEVMQDTYHEHMNGFTCEVDIK